MKIVVLQKCNDFYNQQMNTVILPEVLQKHQKAMELQSKQKESTFRIKESKSNCDSLAAQIKSLNTKKTTIKEKLVEAIICGKIYEVKSANTEKNVEAEKQGFATLEGLDFLARLPDDDDDNKTNYRATQKSDIRKVIEQCLQLVHSSEINQRNYIDFFAEKLGDVPKHTIWKILTKILEESVKVVDNLVNQPPIMNEEREEAMLKLGVAKGYAQHVILKLDGRKIDDDLAIVDKMYVKEFQRFFKLIFAQVRRTSSGEIDNELVARFIEKHVLKMYVKGQIEFVLNQLKVQENQNHQITRHLEENRVSVEKYASIYEEINQSCDKIHTNILNSSTIKDKLFHTQKMIQRNVELGKLGRHNLNETMDAFAANESVLCSTKFGLDLERPRDSIISAPQNQIPPAISEVQLFHTIPIFRLRKMSNGLEFFIGPAHTTRTPPELLDATNFHYLTGAGALEESKRSSLIGEMLGKVSKMVRLGDINILDC